MRFEVRRNGKVVFVTDHEGCIPDRVQRDQLRKSGHKLYIDGKAFAEPKKKE